MTIATQPLAPLSKTEEMTQALLDGNYAVAMAESQIYSMNELVEILHPKFGRKKSTLAAAMLLKGKINVMEYKSVLRSDNEERSFTS